MKIAHVITGLGVGGAERVLLDLCGELAAKGHEVAIWSLTSDIGALTRGYDNRVDIHVLGISHNPLTWIRALIRFLSGFRQYRPQVLHVHMFHALAFAVMASLLLPARPRLFFTSHSQVIKYRWRRLFIYATRRWRDADIIFSSGQHIKLNARDSKVIPNGISTERAAKGNTQPRLSSRPWRFINVARLSEAKDHEALVIAFAKFIKGQTEAELWLVGDGPLRSRITETEEKNGVAGHVKLLGNRSDVMELLDAADVFVMSSKWEGLPIALLEAGLLGLPVISTPVGSIPDVLAEGCGILVPQQELAAAMSSVITNWQASLAMGKKLQKRIESHYSIDAMARAHVDLYMSMTKESPAHRNQP